MAQFQKGQSGNPSGRPKLTLKDGRSLRDLAREHTESAITTLIELMEDKMQPGTVRAGCAGQILDRGWGRPPQALEHSGPDGGPIQFDVTKLTDEQLAALEALECPEA